MTEFERGVKVGVGHFVIIVGGGKHPGAGSDAAGGPDPGSCLRVRALEVGKDFFALVLCDGSGVLSLLFWRGFLNGSIPVDGAGGWGVGVELVGGGL